MRIHEQSWSALALVLAGILVQAGCSDPASAPSEDASIVADEPFHLQDGTEVSVPLMHQTNSFLYAEAEGVQVVELPYERRELAMVVILPAQGRFQEVATSLDGSRLDALLGDLRARDVVLTLPRFTYESSYSLKDVLVELGMVDVFGAADFSGMNGVGGLFILDVLHRAFIAVDEEGTEAAASTAVIVNIDAGVPTDAEVPPPVTFTADRPFLFLIRDRPTQAILFMGRVEDPR